MSWTPPNPDTKPLLDQSSDIDARIRAANPTGPLKDTEVVVTNGDTDSTTDGGSVAFTVANSILTEVAYTPAATKCLVETGDTDSTTDGGSVAFTVANSVLTEVAYTPAATKYLAETGEVINIDGGGTVELTIAGGVITSAVYTAP